MKLIRDIEDGPWTEWHEPTVKGKPVDSEGAESEDELEGQGALID